MYDDTQATNTAIDQVATDIDTNPPSFGLGSNPSSAAPNMSTPLPPSTQSDQVTTDPEAAEIEASLASLPTPSTTHAAVSSAEPAVSSELLDIKKDALSHLAPLIDKLHQTPEERYKTLMMVIQASDDQSLVKKAYDSASQIEDETVRAEALLAVVNEINYFTQKPTE